MDADAGAAELAVRGVMSTPAPAPAVVADMATTVAAAITDLFLVKRSCNRLCGVSVWSAGDADRTLAGMLPDDLLQTASACSISVCTTTAGIRSCTRRGKVDMVAIKGKHECGDGLSRPRPRSCLMLQEAQSRSTHFGERQSGCAPAPSSCTAGRATCRLDIAGVDSLDGRVDIADLLGEELSEASDDSNSLMFPRHARKPASRNLEGGNLASSG